MGICEDTGVAEHMAGTAELGVDVYVAGLVHMPSSALEEQDAQARYRALMIRQIQVRVLAGPLWRRRRETQRSLRLPLSYAAPAGVARLTLDVRTR